MFCLKCGKEIADDAMKCPYCDCPTENAGTTIDTSSIDPTIKSADSMGLIGIVTGSIGILFAWLFALIGWILGGTGLALSLVGKNKNPGSSKCRIALIVSIIALVCSFASSLIGALMML